MSAAYFIVLENKKPGFDPLVNGKFLSKEIKNLDRLCENLGINDINSFVSYAPEELDEMMQELGVDACETNSPAEQWFEPDEGLTWVTRLIEYLEAQPATLQKSKEVLSDLREYEQVFKKAKAIGSRWRLHVDF